MNRCVELLQLGAFGMHHLREIDEVVAGPRGEECSGNDDHGNGNVRLEAVGEAAEAGIPHRELSEESGAELCAATRQRHQRVDNSPQEKEESEKAGDENQ